MLESVHQLSHSHQAQDLSDQPKSKNKTKRIELHVVIKFALNIVQKLHSYAHYLSCLPGMAVLVS